MNEVLIALLLGTAGLGDEPLARPAASLPATTPLESAAHLPHVDDTPAAAPDHHAHLAWLARRWSWYCAHETTRPGRVGAMPPAPAHEICF